MYMGQITARQGGPSADHLWHVFVARSAFCVSFPMILTAANNATKRRKMIFCSESKCLVKFELRQSAIICIFMASLIPMLLAFWADLKETQIIQLQREDRQTENYTGWGWGRKKRWETLEEFSLTFSLCLRLHMLARTHARTYINTSSFHFVY